jgi:hypothetical protein
MDSVNPSSSTVVVYAEAESDDGGCTVEVDVVDGV